jgi:tetratricopeptide (TPR) repeat protein
VARFAQDQSPADTITSLYAIEAYDFDAASLAEADKLLDAAGHDPADPGYLLARGRTLHARFLVDRSTGTDEELRVLEQAEQLFRAAGDQRGLAEALFWIGTYHQVVRRDNDGSVPYFHQAYEAAISADDAMVLSCVERHLGFVEILAGRRTEAFPHLNASVRLRREIGFDAGAAAALLALAEATAEGGDPGAASALLDEAKTLADTVGASGVLRHIEEFRRSLA